MQLILVTSWSMSIGVFLLTFLFHQKQVLQAGVWAVVFIFPKALLSGIAAWIITFVAMLPIAAMVSVPTF